MGQSVHKYIKGLLYASFELNSINSGVGSDEMLFKIKCCLNNHESVMKLDPNIKAKLIVCDSMYI